ncbi:glycosyl transferase [Pseudomonas sp. Leaf127]|uniref:glycosyltransferase family 2 protein n=1 Tax=Pseudomonas sp. Leaf127 TaxID=1736267 RepID=UPI0007030F87|nr:glycosyltransferase family 2 protein [Pseudomonas sp. Leaf127]KQQ65563.1 glycosyl transferase [Pseudomonas sp. Leaf127]
MDHFHRQRQSGQHGDAAACLERALQTPEYRPEALIWKGIQALQEQRPTHAFIYLTSAANALPDRADVRALVGRSILAQQQPALAARQLTAAWQQMPADPALRIMLWQVRSKTETPEKLRKQILARLPEITDPKELHLVLSLLATQPNPLASVGVVTYEVETGEVQGWAVDLRNPGSVVGLSIINAGQSTQCAADKPHPLLTQAGFPAAHGGIQEIIRDAALTLDVQFSDGTPLLGSPLLNQPPFVSPVQVGKTRSRQEPVDILVPVYDGYEETLECLNSVIRSRGANRTAHRLVVLDDVTPNAQLREALLAMAAAGDIEHVINPVNLGFIRNVNRGMALSPERDVVWLNADTRVHGDWLDRLRAVAYSDKGIASVTPFTNNGELMSFPESRVSHPMPTAEQQAHLDDLARQTDSPAMEIETGCGFCLYIKRRAIVEVGYLDEVHLMRGYGEETDWCLRARSHGWRHMGAPNVFVAHQGGASFGDEKIIRVAYNNAILRKRYPDASARYSAFCLRDTIKPARQALQRARLGELSDHIATHPERRWPKTGLKQLHLHTGKLDDMPLSLIWRYENQQVWVTLQANLQPLAFSLDYLWPSEHERLLEDLKILPIDEIFYQQLNSCPRLLLDLPHQLGKPYRVVCRDDQLLKSDSSYDWSAFAQLASSVQLPFKALQKRYATALPTVKFSVGKQHRFVAAAKNTSSVLLIADELHSAELAHQWLELGRRITREKLPIQLLTYGNSPWSKALVATGAVHALPNVQGLDAVECMLLSGCKAAISLECNPDADWNAPALASELCVPLYAPPGTFTNEAGAISFKLLPLSLGQV